jgi:hypothetical protein
MGSNPLLAHTNKFCKLALWQTTTNTGSTSITVLITRIVNKADDYTGANRKAYLFRAQK